MSLSSPVVLDEQLAVGPAFGAPGAPSAVVVDENGKIASELAVGAPAVLSVLAQAQSKTGKDGNDPPSAAGNSGVVPEEVAVSDGAVNSPTEKGEERQASRLVAYRTSHWPPMRIVVAPADRDWMDATPNRFANRCLPRE